MTARAETAVSPLAPWALRLALFALQVAVVGFALHRFASLATPVAINVMLVAVVVALIGAFLAIASLKRIWVPRRGGRRPLDCRAGDRPCACDGSPGDGAEDVQQPRHQRHHHRRQRTAANRRRGHRARIRRQRGRLSRRSLFTGTGRQLPGDHADHHQPFAVRGVRPRPRRRREARLGTYSPSARPRVAAAPVPSRRSTTASSSAFPMTSCCASPAATAALASM